MIEKDIIKYLSDNLAVSVQGELEHDTPDRVVTIQGSAADRVNRIDTTTIIASVYAESMVSAAELCEDVKEALFELTDLDSVSSSKLVTSYPAPDTVNKRYRYQAVFNITHY